MSNSRKKDLTVYNNGSTFSEEDMKITRMINNGYWTYKLDYHLAGRRKRSYFSDRAKAEKELARVTKERKRQSDMFVRLSEAEKINMLMAWELAKDEGIRLVDVVQDAIKESREDNEVGTTVGVLVRRFLREKRECGLRPATIKGLTSTIERFAEDIWNEPIMAVNRKIIWDFLITGKKSNGEAWHTRTKRGYLKDIQSFMNWCYAEREIDYNPAASIRPPRYTEAELEERENRKEILTPKEAQHLMEVCVKHYPKLAPRVAIVLFAGLRPDREAEGVRMEDIDFDHNLLLVRPSRAKDRQSRYIEMQPNLVAWLKWSFGQGHTLPITNWRRLFDALRKKAGLYGETWPKNAGRHSFASYHLDLAGEDATRKALGHGTFDMLFQHYRTLVRPGVGAKYFEILPRLTPSCVALAVKQMRNRDFPAGENGVKHETC